MDGFFRVTGPRRQSARRLVRNGQRAAALRAITAAKLYLNKSISTLDLAAASCGSNVPYVRAAITLLRSENTQLLDHALTGAVPLLEAAARAERLAELVTAYRHATPEDLAALGRTLGAEAVFANVIEPALG